MQPILIHGLRLRSDKKISYKSKLDAVLTLRYEEKDIYIIPLILIPIVKKDSKVDLSPEHYFPCIHFTVKDLSLLNWNIEWHRPLKADPEIEIEFLKSEIKS